MNNHQLYRTITEDYDASFYFVYEWERAADWNFQHYRIPAMTFWYVIEGGRMLHISGEAYKVEPGSIIALPPHAIVTTDYLGVEQRPIHYLSMGIHAVMGGIDWVAIYGIPIVLPVSPNDELSELIRIWLELKADVSQIQQMTILPSDSLLSARYAALALSWEGKLKLWLSLMTRLAVPFMSSPDPISDKRVRDICSYIRGNYVLPFSSEDLARHVCLSEGHMRAIFRQTMGMSPHQYTLHVRMEKAKELLVSTKLILTEIAAKVGFEDLSYFISLFRKREGMTPTAYRKRIYPWKAN